MFIEDSSKVFFTSDTHFSHSNIIKFCDRPYSNVSEMNSELINNWNKVVPKDGIVFHLGDFAWSGSINKYKELLNGEIHLIYGNHDKDCISSNAFASKQPQLVLNIDGKLVYLNHFPYLCFPMQHMQLFGHVHLSKYKNTGYDFEICVKNLKPNQYDVGVDLNDFTPISWKEVHNRIRYQKEHNINCTSWIYA